MAICADCGKTIPDDIQDKFNTNVCKDCYEISRNRVYDYKEQQ